MDVFPHFGVTSCVRQNVWYCTQKSLIKDSYDKQQNEVQLSVVEVGKFHVHIKLWPLQNLYLFKY